MAIAAGLVLIMVLLLWLGVSRIVDVHPAGPTTTGPSLGVFESIRGRIVYQNLGHLEAIDPQDPSTPAIIETLDAPWAVPSGWSADGSVLALEQEGGGGLFVMNQDGAMINVASSGGCCTFTTDNWLSPDGSQMTTIQPDGNIAVMNLDGSNRSQLTRVPDGVRYGSASWSPTGSQIAVVVRPGDLGEGNSIALIDVQTAAIRPVSGSDLPWIRQITWSPDGTQTVAIASDHTPGGLGKRGQPSRTAPPGGPLSHRCTQRNGQTHRQGPLRRRDLVARRQPGRRNRLQPAPKRRHRHRGRRIPFASSGDAPRAGTIRRDRLAPQTLIPLPGRARAWSISALVLTRFSSASDHAQVEALAAGRHRTDVGASRRTGWPEGC